MRLWGNRFRSCRRTMTWTQKLKAIFDRPPQDMVDRGATPAEARYIARREFGNIGLVREVSRETWISQIADRIAQDARYAWRGIRTIRGLRYSPSPASPWALEPYEKHARLAGVRGQMPAYQA
jgi:hypothetical protein